MSALPSFRYALREIAGGDVNLPMPTVSARYAKEVVLFFICGTCFFCLFGCASSSIEYSSHSKLGPDEGLVCGRVMTLRGDQPIIWEGGAFATTGMQVYVMPES